jgi:hypothetical protein
MSIRILIASMVGMAVVTRIKNENLRASIGIPLVAFMMFTLLSLSVSAQWVPDRPDYNIVSEGNFSMIVKDREEAIEICKTTLQTNNIILRTIDVDKKNLAAPLFSSLVRESDPNHIFFAYVARKRSGEYIIQFRYLPNETVAFKEDFIILEYVK